MAVVTAAITGGLGVAATITGALINKNATTSAANATSAATLQALNAQIAERQRITDQATQAAQMSPSEINQINSLLTTKGQALTASQDAIQKQQSQLDAMDPNVKAAGNDLYSLLTGKAAATIAPLQAQITMQRNQQMNDLASQYGPGFMATSAGIEAMMKFDTNSAVTIANASQSALGQATQTYLGLTGQQQQGQAGITAATQNAFAQSENVDQTVLAADQNVQGRLENAITQGANQPVNFQAPAQVAGNLFAGDQAFGQSISGLGAGLGKISGAAVGSASAPVTTTGALASVPSAANFGDTIGNTFSSPGLVTGKAGS